MPTAFFIVGILICTGMPNQIWSVGGVMSENVELSNVFMDFGQFRAVNNVDVTIKAGEFFSFLGPSGCGKTTILRLISGFMEPSKGAIKIGGKDMVGVAPNARPTALIFQNLALFPLMPVWENIAFGLEVRGIDKAARRAKAEELLKLVDLHDAADKKISQLSGGQKQRVAIARAVISKPDIILADEPTGNLDSDLAIKFMYLFEALNQWGTTILFATHDEHLISQFNYPVLKLRHGRIFQEKSAL